MGSTPNYGLETWSSSEYGDEVLNFVDGLSGATSSNMTKIDTQMKTNADGVASVTAFPIRMLSAIYQSSGYYESTISSYTTYTTGNVFLIKLDVSVLGATTLNINSIGVLSIMKYNTSGAIVNLDANDMTSNGIYVIFYDGTRWVLINSAGYQPRILDNGILKGDGSGNISAATAGSDYADPTKMFYPDNQYGVYLSSNLNDITVSGFYFCASSATGAPNSSHDWFVVHMNNSSGTNYAQQTAISQDSTIIKYRYKSGGVWGSWAAYRADQVDVQDASNNYNQTNVEDILAEIAGSFVRGDRSQSLSSAYQTTSRNNISASGVNPYYLGMNTDWTTPINIRSATGSISNAYCIDRWIGNGTVTPVSGSYVTLANGTTMIQRQDIYPSKLYSIPVTLSIMIGNTIQSATLTYPSSGSGSAVSSSLTGVTAEIGFINLGSGNTSLLEGVASQYIPYWKWTATSDINVQLIKIERGEISTLSKSPPIDRNLELLRCSAYCQKLISTASGITGIIGSGVYTNVTNTASLACPLVCPMRIVPTATLLSGGYLYGDGVYPQVTAASVVGATSTFVNISCTSVFEASHFFNSCVWAGGASVLLSSDL